MLVRLERMFWGSPGWFRCLVIHISHLSAGGILVVQWLGGMILAFRDIGGIPGGLWDSRYGGIASSKWRSGAYKVTRNTTLWTDTQLNLKLQKQIIEWRNRTGDRRKLDRRSFNVDQC